MKYQPKLNKRLGAIIGAVVGVFAMITAVCFKKNLLGAVLLIACCAAGYVIGSLAEKGPGQK